MMESHQSRRLPSLRMFIARLLVVTLWGVLITLFFINDIVTLHILLAGIVGLVFVAGIIVLRSIHKEIEHQEDMNTLRHSLERANTHLREVDASKNEFLSLAAHQLKSPLTSLTWGLQGMRDMVNNPDEHENIRATLEKMEMTTQELISTVNDLLDISKIDQGGLVLKKERMNIADLAERITEEFKVSAQRKGLTMIFDCAPDAQCMVEGDATKLRQVFVNLLDNAVKYTPAGVITVRLFHKIKKKIRIEISDTGMGMSREETKKIFQKFVRGHAGKTVQGGSGLGLYLAYKIIEMHRGTMQVTSLGINKGSTFYFEIPCVSE